MADSYGFIGGLKVATDTVPDGNGGTANVLKTIGGGSGGSTSVQGNSASGAADTGNPVKIGAVVSTAAPAAMTAGNRTDLLADARGNLKVGMYTPNGDAFGFGATNADGLGASATATRLTTLSFNLLFNGTTFDRQRKPNVYARVASSAASGNPATGKASAGDVFGWWGQNGAAITYLQIYNKASNPVIGTDIPALTFPIPANAAFSQSVPMGAYLGTGVAFAFTTDAAGTTGAAAAAITAFTMLIA